MARRTKSPQVNFLVSPELLERLQAAARRADKTVSEWCRDALRAAVARETAPSVSPGEGEPGRRG